jgi:antitoxin PrlF
MESALTSKGQATIPKQVRDHLRLQAGDRIKFFFHPDGHVAILPKIPTASLKGLLRSRLAKAPTLEEMDDAIGAALVEKFKRK